MNKAENALKERYKIILDSYISKKRELTQRCQESLDTGIAHRIKRVEIDALREQESFLQTLEAGLGEAGILIKNPADVKYKTLEQMKRMILKYQSLRDRLTERTAEFEDFSRDQTMYRYEDRVNAADLNIQEQELLLNILRDGILKLAINTIQNRETTLVPTYQEHPTQVPLLEERILLTDDGTIRLGPRGFLKYEVELHSEGSVMIENPIQGKKLNEAEVYEANLDKEKILEILKGGK